MDLSAASLSAWRQAHALALEFNASLTVIHVTRATLGAAERRTLLNRIRTKIGTQKVHLVRSEPVAAILRTAKSLRSDLIVMGAHSHTSLERLILGSTTEGVVAKSPIPVMSLRGHARPIRSILAPVALAHYGPPGLAAAAELASDLTAWLTLFHVSRAHSGGANPRDVLENLVERLPEKINPYCRIKTAVSSGDPAKTIIAEALEHDLVCLVSHRKGPIKDWLVGTTVERVLRRCPTPVLSLPYLAPESDERQKVLGEVFTEAPKA